MKQFGHFDPKYTDPQSSKIILLPVPYDGTSTWMKGSDRGPQAIIEASEHLEYYDIETGSEVYMHGIHVAEPVREDTSPEKVAHAAEKRVLELLDRDKFIVTLGGEHSVTIGPVRAFASRFENLSVLQIDAHADTRESYMGSRFNHACVMARVKELCPIVQVGIRSMDVEERPGIDPSRVFYAWDILQGDDSWMDEVVGLLTGQVYITIDLDAFDPAYMPSTGTPEPGGLDYYLVLKLIRKVMKEREVVGFDVVELCPNPQNKAPDFLAAKLVYQVLSSRFA